LLVFIFDPPYAYIYQHKSVVIIAQCWGRWK